jgi:hypothetical protein
LYHHDAEKYAIERWDEVVKHLKDGTEFKSTNTPKGHVHSEWSIAEVMESEKHTARPLDVKTWGNEKSKQSNGIAIHIERLTLSDPEEA